MSETPAIKPAIPFALLGGDAEEVFEQVRVGMPPLAEHLQPVAAIADLPDLSKQVRTWLLIGPGGAGKTLLARWLADTATAQGYAGTTLLAALDPTNRTLAEFFPDAHQPKTADAADTFAFLRRLIRATCNRRAHGIFDFGGGDLSMTQLIAASPKLEDAMRLQGVALVPVYVLTPRVDDLSILDAHTERGFAPKTMILLLNLGRAQNLAAFGAIRAQAAYRAAIERGAVEIIMPPLDDEIARLLERRRGHFYEAAAEENASFGGIEAMILRDWLAKMRAAFAPVATWMPWG